MSAREYFTGRRKIAVVTLFGAASIASVLLVPLIPVIAQIKAVTEQQMRNSILGREPATSEMDLNNDQVVDVADLIATVSTPGTIPLAGNTWVVSVAMDQTEQNKAPFFYQFAINFPPAGSRSASVSSTVLGGFDSTRAFLAQPGTTVVNDLTSPIPDETRFTYSTTAAGKVRLVSADVTVPKDLNPLGRDLTRRWIIEFDQASVESQGEGYSEQGTVREETFGFLPDNRPFVTLGRIRMAPHTAVQ